MKLTRIELEDFRCFGKAEFDLNDPASGGPLDVVLLVGGNGSGKSSVLQALSGFFTALWSSYGGEPLNHRDVREGADRARLAVSFHDWLGRSRQRLLQRSFAITTHVEGDELIPPENEEYKEWLRQTTGPMRRSTGLIVGFDIYRPLPPARVFGPNLEGEIQHRGVSALAPSVSSKGRIQPRAHYLKQWIVNLDNWRAKAKADRGEDLPLWHTLRHALNTLLAPYIFEGVDYHFEVLFQTPTGRVPIEALSDGYRSVFVVVTELLLRLSLATDNPEQVLEQEAVCLIDEVDAHLHPRWQENVIPGMRTLFPNVQFIATTHSEIVVSTVEPKNVFRLEEVLPAGSHPVRQDARFHLPERRVVSIAREVFGAQPGTAGRPWLIDPPPEVRRRFWETFGPAIEPHHEVFVAEGSVLLEQVQDIHDRPIPGLDGHAGAAALFFIDLEPAAAWSHPCAYVVLPAVGKPLRLEHIWPPSEAVRLNPLPRPPLK